MSHAVALAIVNRENQPVYIKLAPQVNDSESNRLIYILYSGLDFIDEKQSQQRDPYLGLLSQLDNLKIYGLLSTTKIKVILILNAATGSPPLRDPEVRNMVKQVYSAFVDEITCNPFYSNAPCTATCISADKATNESTKNKSFDSVIRNVFCK